MKDITVNGETYILKKDIAIEKYTKDWMIVRTYAAGVFFCKIKERTGTEASLIDSRRIWSWKGAYELTDLAVNGPAFPDECKLSVTIPCREIMRIEEILPVSEKAYNLLSNIKEWVYEK